MTRALILSSLILSASIVAGCSSNSANDDPISPIAGDPTPGPGDTPDGDPDGPAPGPDDGGDGDPDGPAPGPGDEPDVDPGTPVTEIYTPTFATATLNSVGAAFAANQRIQGGAAPVLQSFGNPTTRSLAEPGSVELERTANGYTLRYDDEVVTFTQDDLLTEDGGFNSYENAQGFIASLGAASTTDALSSTETAMVPLQFSISTNEQGQATAQSSDGNALGYTIIGVETAVSDMPNTGGANYTGRARVEAYSRARAGSANEVDRIRYQGASTVSANFGTGIVSGTVALDQRNARVGGVNSGNVNISDQGAAFQLAVTPIVGNGFESEIVGNDAANALIAADGISDDTEVLAVGRFFGNDASQVGAVIGGEGTSHVVTGVLFGDQN